MISEEKMLMIALCSMVALAFLAATIFHLAGAGPIATIFGGTAIGVIAYIAICVYGKPYVKESALHETLESDANNNVQSN